MNIDEKIKKELQTDAAELDQILAHQDGLFSMVRTGFKGSLGIWFVLVNIVTLIATATLIWCGYKFVTVEVGEQLFWGVWLIVSLQVQIALKQWLFNEMGRSSLAREMKRIELSVVELEEKMTSRT